MPWIIKKTSNKRKFHVILKLYTYSIITSLLKEILRRSFEFLICNQINHFSRGRGRKSKLWERRGHKIVSVISINLDRYLCHIKVKRTIIGFVTPCIDVIDRIDALHSINTSSLI